MGFAQGALDTDANRKRVPARLRRAGRGGVLHDNAGNDGVPVREAISSRSSMTAPAVPGTGARIS